MSRRVYSAEPIAPDGIARIGDAEAHHLLHVLRVRAGDELTLFDGRGGEFRGEVVGVSRREVEVRVGPRLAIERELVGELVLAAPLPKGDRTRWLVEKAVELGVARLVPLATARSEAPSKGGEKLDRYVIEASKQCGRNRLMELAPVRSWREWLAAGPGDDGVDATPDAVRWIAHPGGAPLAEAARPTHARAWLAVGPEGGFADEEIADARTAGWQIVDLGERILRIETAAAALVTAATLLARRP
ncbi:MAG: 16S rRNA (uracil(1498)-N(3))-methyltransferase [Pirellulales bacterium]|nr:16S rRNA (uracil(1498)-N(3))-methyltransferase [Pirellulales bacterium]